MMNNTIHSDGNIAINAIVNHVTKVANVGWPSASSNDVEETNDRPRRIGSGRKASRSSGTAKSIENPGKGRIRLKGTYNDSRHDLAAHFSRIERHLFETPSTLTDSEIIEMTLSIALPARDIRPVAKALLSKYRSLSAVVAAPAPKLLAIRGLGKKGVAVLKLMHASTTNVLRNEITKAPVITGWDQLIDYLSVHLKHQRVEHFHLLFLDGRGALIADEVQSRGTVNRVAVYPREVVRRCLELHAHAFIMVHNHPSGDPSPSGDDVEMTLAVQRAAATMGIALRDHIIVSRFGCLSFRQAKLI